MLSFRFRSWVTLGVFLGLALLRTERAWADSFEVSPIRISLSQETPSALLTVHNQSAEPLRFQVTAFAWKQGPGGDMQLAPTKDVVFFPSMLTLQGGESRSIRVGNVAPMGAVESTYRIFVEELPPLAKQGAPGAIRVLTRMGVPIFIARSGVAPAAPRIQRLSAQARKVAFSLENAGGAHFLAQKVRVSALDKEGKAIFERDLPAWYVLAGDARRYELDLPDAACSAARVVVAATTDSGAAQASLDLTGRDCSP